MKNNKSHKKKGGDINKHNAFKYILSIGYEVETDYLVKLTSAYNEEGEMILFNSDSNTRNIEYLTIQNIDEDEYNDSLRREEVMDIKAYNNENKLDKNIHFLVTNDMASTNLSKKLNKMCCPNSSNNDLEESSFCGVEVSIELKNKLYKFYTPEDFVSNKDEEYNIEFVFFNNTDCGTFSDVEWVITYYKPFQSENIILDTFKNVLFNLTKHLEGLNKIEGSLVLNEMNIRDKNGEIIKTYPERIITNPVNRYLFKSPDLNLYYLQSNNSTELLNVDHICPVFQMTFAANIIHIFSILKQLIDDKIMSLSCNIKEMKYKLDILQKIEYCVDRLIQQYNEKQRNPYFKIIKTDSTKNTIKQIKSYLGLFLFRLYIYYNIFLKKEINVKKENENKPVELQRNIYFKDSLYFNPRHSNYDFYLAIKKCFKELFSNAINQITNDENKQNQIVVDLIHKLILDPTILNELLLEPTTLSQMNQNIFEPKNRIKKNDVNYGNPTYSLDSYLSFFEKPIDNDSNLYEDDTIMYYDWLQYKGIDKVSTQMIINDNIILVEVRNFQKLMSSYVYGFANDSLKNDIINNKKCNKLDKNSVLGINFGDLKKFFQISNQKMGGNKRKWNTRKNRKKIAKN